MALDVQSIANAVVLLAPENVVESDLIEGGAGCVCRDMSANAV